MYEFKVKTHSGVDTHKKISHFQVVGGDLVLFRAAGTYETIGDATITYKKGEWLRSLRSDHCDYEGMVI
jgi:hypothetical protein